MTTIEEEFAAAETITVITGAGVSTESGIPDFQTIDEDWPFEEERSQLIHKRMFEADRKKFWAAYRHIFLKKSAHEWFPNSFHQAVARWESEGKRVVVLTQNVDGLHERAGSSMVLELHGNIREVICHRGSCPYRVPLLDSHDETSRCPHCRKFLRPDTVLFGEVPRHLKAASVFTQAADLLIVAGTALEVWPVNELPRGRTLAAPDRPSIWVNRVAAPAGYSFSHEFRGELKDFAK